MASRLGDSHSLSEPGVALQVSGKSIDLLLDSGATYSVLTSSSGPTVPSPIPVTGWMGPPPHLKKPETAYIAGKLSQLCSLTHPSQI